MIFFYFREFIGYIYFIILMMVNGNGFIIGLGIGFYQLGIMVVVLYFNNVVEFNFRNINNNGYCNVYVGNFIVDVGFFYFRYNGIEIKIGFENDLYVYFIIKFVRSLYFVNSLFVNGSVLFYSSFIYSLGDVGYLWNYVYGNYFMGNFVFVIFIFLNYVGG